MVFTIRFSEGYFITLIIWHFEILNAYLYEVWHIYPLRNESASEPTPTEVDKRDI